LALHSISRNGDWKVQSFIKLPLEILRCQYLNSYDKILWAVLNNLADFPQLNKTDLDRLTGVHRTTRMRSIAALEYYGFILTDSDEIVINDYLAVIQYLRQYPPAEFIYQKPQVKDDSQTFMNQAAEAWNRNLPSGYAKMRKMSVQLLKSLDTHIASLGLTPRDYDDFFSVIKKGISKSDFWSSMNSSKTLASIIGIGNPSAQKFHNVCTLYNEGLEELAYDNFNVSKDKIYVNRKYRDLILSYAAADYHYAELYEKGIDPDQSEFAQEIIDLEEKLKKNKIDPSYFRVPHKALQSGPWPTGTPYPVRSYRLVYTDDN
jgi:hypothetical protein